MVCNCKKMTVTIWGKLHLAELDYAIVIPITTRSQLQNIKKSNYE